MDRGDLTEYVAKARALYAERCQKAGVRITRTVSGERGLVVMKLRPKSDYFDEQYVRADQYGRDYNGDGYLVRPAKFTQPLSSTRGRTVAVC